MDILVVLRPVEPRQPERDLSAALVIRLSTICLAFRPPVQPRFTQEAPAPDIRIKNRLRTYSAERRR